MKRIYFIGLFLCLMFFTYHIVVYLHEWAHGTVAWFSGYKSSPFDIHYGKRWVTLLDINEKVDYQQIFSEGKGYLIAWIAITPIVLQMIFFPIGLQILNRYKGWLFAFVYCFTLLLLAEIYGYIPIRTFSQEGDVFNFLTITKFSPWVVAILGTLYVIWGFYQMFVKILPKAYVALDISTRFGQFCFTCMTLIIFFGYYGGIGFTEPDAISHAFSIGSWILLVLSLVISVGFRDWLFPGNGINCGKRG